MRLALGQLHLVARDGDDLALGRVRRARRDDLQTHGRALLAADHVHDLVELHVHDVDEGVVALGDGGDAVVDLEFALRRRRAAGDQFDDLGIAVLAAQHGADAHEREAHVDGKIIHLAGLMYSLCGS